MTFTNPLSQKPIVDPAALTLRISGWGKLVYAALLAAIVALGATGIAGALILGSPMPLWLLMIHVSFAPMFAIALALVALAWADRNRFGDDRSRMCGLAKTMFWLVMVLGLAVMLSGVVPMTPLFGTDGQHFLFYTHRYCAWALAAVVVLHLLSLIRTGGKAS